MEESRYTPPLSLGQQNVQHAGMISLLSAGPLSHPDSALPLSELPQELLCYLAALSLDTFLFQALLFPQKLNIPVKMARALGC